MNVNLQSYVFMGERERLGGATKESASKVLFTHKQHSERTYSVAILGQSFLSHSLLILNTDMNKAIVNSLKRFLSF